MLTISPSSGAGYGLRADTPPDAYLFTRKPKQQTSHLAYDAYPTATSYDRKESYSTLTTLINANTNIVHPGSNDLIFCMLSMAMAVERIAGSALRISVRSTSICCKLQVDIIIKNYVIIKTNLVSIKTPKRMSRSIETSPVNCCHTCQILLTQWHKHSRELDISSIAQQIISIVSTGIINNGRLLHN